MKKAIFFALVVSSILCSFQQLFADDIEIHADYLEYDDAEQFMLARGSVTIQWSNRKLEADTVRYWVEKNYIFAEKNIVLSVDLHRIYADTLTYDIQTETGTINKASAFFDPWIFHSRKTIQPDKDRFSARANKFTTCDKQTPHYYLRANKATIIPNKKIIMYNPIFFLHGVPIFYLPVFYQGLGKRRHSLEVYPGYNNVDGLILRVIYGYPLTANTYGKLYIDSYSKRGLGTGVEYNYDIPGKAKGTLYSYRIKEKRVDEINDITTYSERWNIRAEHWHKINTLWTTQAKLDYVSDSSFNNNYFQENWTRITRELNSHLSFIRQAPTSALRFTTERKDSYQQSTNDFSPDIITFPKIEYNRYPKKNKLGFYTNVNASIVHSYLNSNEFYIWSGANDISITRNYRINRNLSLTPTLGFNESWQDRVQHFDGNNVRLPGEYEIRYLFSTRYYSTLNMRYRLGWWVDWNFLYSYHLRSKTNLFDIDVNGADYGEETNKVDYRNSMYLLRKLIVRNSTSFNFQRSRNIVYADWRERLSPLVNECIWQPKFPWSIYVREETNIYPHKLNSIQNIISYGFEDYKKMSIGMFYNGASPQQLDFNISFGVKPTKKWAIQYTLNASTYERLKLLEPNDQELKLTRDLHCWDMSMRFRKRLDYEEIYFSIDLKSAIANRNKLYNRPHEKEFYPWRD